MQRRAVAELDRLLREKLAAAEIPAAATQGYVTPRRLTVMLEGIPAASAGPDRGAPRASSRSAASRDRGLPAVGRHRLDRGVRGSRHRPGRVLFRGDRSAGPPRRRGVAGPGEGSDFRAALAEIDAVPGFVAALGTAVDLGDQPVRRRGAAAGVRPGRGRRVDRGHRFLSPEEICVGNADEYVARLGNAHVLLDQDRRRETIQKASNGGAPMRDRSSSRIRGLLEEVTGLVEFPVVLTGLINAEFMTLPPEVLATAMRTHQKYFSCLRAMARPLRGSCSSPITSPRTAARRSSPAMSGCCGRALPMRGFSGTRIGGCRSRRVSSPVGAGISCKARQPAGQGQADGGARRVPRAACPGRRLPGRSVPCGSPRPTCRAAWSASFPNCRA